MKVWLPYIEAGSGTDVFTKSLQRGLVDVGVEVDIQRFPYRFQHAPWLLRAVSPPGGTTAVITNSWSGFAFHRGGLKSVTVEHLFVLDPALAPYRSVAQSAYHRIMVRNFVARSYRSADHVVAVSRYTMSRVHEAFADAHATAILNGIDTDFFTPVVIAPPPDPTLRPFRLLFIGNLTRRKGVDLLAPVMRALGEGFELRYTSGRAGETMLPDAINIRRLGRLTLEETRRQYRECDALLFPTRLEGLPLVVMEALSCGLPVISSDSASLPEVVDHGETGLVCPTDDVGAMVAAARTLRADPARLQAMKARARTVAVERFGLRRMVAEYLAVLGVPA